MARRESRQMLAVRRYLVLLSCSAQTESLLEMRQAISSNGRLCSMFVGENGKKFSISLASKLAEKRQIDDRGSMGSKKDLWAQAGHQGIQAFFGQKFPVSIDDGGIVVSCNDR